MSHRRDLQALIALLLLDQEGRGLLGRVASRATGAVADIVDPDAIVERIDVDAVLERVDVNRLLERVDINALLDRVDVDRLMARVDVKALAEQAGIPDIVRESTGELAGSALDVLRRQVVAFDTIAGGAAYRLIGRDPAERPSSPPQLAEDTRTGRRGRGLVTGHYAGPLSRLVAFLIDTAIVWFSWVLTTAGIAIVVGLFTGTEPGGGAGGPIALILLVVWGFLYLWVTLTIAGRTPGMGIVGIRVVDRQGAPLAGRQALIRTLVFPFSFLILGLGFVGIFTSPERRTLHDAAAGSVVVYDWGDRPAEMPAPLTRWINRRGYELPTEPEDYNKPA